MSFRKLNIHYLLFETFVRVDCDVLIELGFVSCQLKKKKEKQMGWELEKGTPNKVSLIPISTEI